VYIDLSGDPEPPDGADFGIKIAFLKNTGNPRRVFDAASLLIAGFEQLDETITISVDSKIESVLLLEDIEAGSITIWLKNILKAIPDEGLKDLEWKKAVGTYLVKAKYVALQWLDLVPKSTHQRCLTSLENYKRWRFKRMCVTCLTILHLTRDGL
jgi:hypothetical protein